MDQNISAAEANRQFSQVLRDVREGETYVVTAHGKPVARIIPCVAADAAREAARSALAQRLAGQETTDIGAWSRDELLRALTLRIALDTNILVYAEGVNGAERRAAAAQVMAGLAAEEIVLPVQALAELFAVLTRKARIPPAEARLRVLGWHDAYPVIDTSAGILIDAMELAARHGFGLFDAVMVAAAAQAGCRRLLSEDMHDGFLWRGVAISNPFAPQAAASPSARR